MNPSRVVAEVSLKQLRSNLEILARLARANAPDIVKGAVAMVKANAYGHGIDRTARALESPAFTLALGVAAVEEGAELREAGVHKPIWVFSGSGLAVAGSASYMIRHGLTPMIHNLADLRELLKKGNRALARNQGFHLKFNTGMNRLGISPDEFSVARRLLERAGVRPRGLCTHFSSAESPRAAITRKQVGVFKQAIAEFSSFGVAYIHSANSAGILNGSSLETSAFSNIIRPGLGLYGYGGVEGNRAGLRPALLLKTQVLSTRRLKTGDLVGYGATHRVGRPTDEAVLAIGYGDGLMRGLSNQTLRIHAGGGLREVKVLGRVSMDLLSLELRSKAGRWVTLLGEDEEQGCCMAEHAGTIVYEILTAISARVPRVYI